MMTRMIQQLPIFTPEELSTNYQITPTLSDFVFQARNTVTNIIHAHDTRTLVVVGPCSINDPIAAMEYAEKLKKLCDKFENELFIVMRVYFEKPRTSIGWKGLLQDPHLKNQLDISTGLKTARKLLININELQIPVATEFVDTLTPPYLQDLVTWGAIGARTSESQIHRQLASCLPMPIGFKNSLAGDIHSAINSIKVAKRPQQMLSINNIGHVTLLTSEGNNNCHIILRGGRTHTNYDQHCLAQSTQLLRENSLNPYIMVDCSHGNSQNDPNKQAQVINTLCDYINQSDSHRIGFMIESHLKSGKQAFNPGGEHLYGLSITDGCISIEETEKLLEKLAHRYTMIQL